MTSFLREFDELLLIRLQKLRELEPELDLREGSIGYDMASAGALADGEVLFNMDVFKEMVFAETSSGEYLDRRAQEIGLTRNAGAKAKGVVEVSGMVSTTIPVGTRFSDVSTSLIYVSTEEIMTTEEGTGTIPIEATEASSAYNLPASAVVQALGDFTDVLTVNNPQPIDGGINVESDEDLYNRYIDKLTNPPVSGNASQYRQWAMSINGVGGAFVIRLWNGPGTVKVVIMNNDKRAPSPELVQAVKNYLNDEDRVPIGAEVTVTGATEKPIAVTATVSLRSGYDLQYAMDEYSKAVDTYIKSMAMQSTTVQYNYFSFAFMNLKSVYNFSNLKINGQTSDIQLTAEQIPVLGSVVFVNG